MSKENMVQSNSSQRNKSQAKTAVPSSPDFLPLEDFWQLKTMGEKNSGLLKDPREVAREEAEEILAQARKEAERIEKDAYEKGLSEGEKAGKAEGERQYEALLSQFGGTIQALHDQRQEVFRKYQKELIPLIKAMVERLVNHEVSVNPRVIQACFEKAMEFVVENSVVHVHLHSEDFNRIKEASLENPALLSGKSRVQLVDDPNISQGGCLLKTDFGEIDSTLENCREKLYEAVDRAFLASLAEDNEDSEFGA